ncbi:Chloroperoxidase [Boletus edulis BED1]|uniref:Chloroperoxidase n=1 Tax=Boletus edulis BED1 TaxID=1328754 RepID=A0AAD4GD43_BOLED|nr:Chloroperoxidase [Boletus edulis BED1]
MKLQSLATLPALISYVLAIPRLADFPEYCPLSGLSSEDIQVVMQTSTWLGPQPLPPPIKDTSAKLVDDAAHPFKPLRPGDIRGPCPGLNTLASHGYIPRHGVVTPAEIITAVQEGFNMGRQFASFLAYSAFILDGNHLTNLMSIGRNTTGCGSLTPGINTHGTFEGDASITREDIYLGNNFLFNEGLFNELIHSANQVGEGYVTVEAAALNRRRRIDDSVARNPVFSFETPRFLGAIAESGFALAMFVHNQTEDSTKSLALNDAWSFFNLHMYPEGFYRRQGPFEFPHVKALTYKLVDMVGRRPGHNEGEYNYVVNPEDPATVNLTAQLYPDPPFILRKAIKANLATYYEALGDPTCEQYFPYGYEY